MRKLFLIFSIGSFILATVLMAEAPINFNHELHVLDMEIDCAACHEGVEESRKGSDDLFTFSHDACYDCHFDAIDEDCGMCHNDLDEFTMFERVTGLMPDFSHKMHLSGHAECADCHKGIETMNSADEQTLAEFSSCLACHEEAKPHPVSHRINWERNHGLAAAVDGDSECSACHSENYCMNCHEGDNLAFQVHPQNFIMLHKNEFMTGAIENCESCHETTECVDCHRINKIRPLNHSSSSWLTYDAAMNGGTHAALGISRIEYCAVCHEAPAEEILCSNCHK